MAFPGDTGAFHDFAQECDAVLLIDDLKNENAREIRRRNPRATIIQRRHYFGAEGIWRDVEYNGKPQTPERMFDVLTAGHDASLEVWLNFGNEPARGHDPRQGGLDQLRADVEWYCSVVMLCVAAKVRVVVMNIQITELTDTNIHVFKPLFELCHKYPQYVAFGVHQYFTLLLSLGVGSGDWSKLLKWGSHPKSDWAKTADLRVNSVEAHIGRDVWLRGVLDAWGFTSVRLFGTEMGFDRINNLPQIEALDAVAGKRVRGLQTILELLKLHDPSQDPLVTAADNVIWMGETLTEMENIIFYNWSTQNEWWDYSASQYPAFRAPIIAHNRRVRSGQVTPPPVEPPPVVIPPTVLCRARTLTTLNLRPEPSINATPITTVPQESVLQVIAPDGAPQMLGKKDMWVKVVTPAALTGWVSAWYLVPYEDTPPAPKPSWRMQVSEGTRQRLQLAETWKARHAELPLLDFAALMELAALLDNAP
jgi:hypothetical protein